MTRPLAVIEGDLALPNARPFGVLPPPFGLVPPEVPPMRKSEPQPRPFTAAQQAILNAMQRQASPRYRGPIPPNVKFLFFYKLPKRRDDTYKIEEQLAEAKYYLQADKARRTSTRSDHLIGGAIFAACSIALAWPLATCTTHEVSKATRAATATATAVTPPLAPTHASEAAPRAQKLAVEPLQPPVHLADMGARNAPPALSAAPGIADTSRTTSAAPKTADSTRATSAAPETANATRATSAATPKPTHADTSKPQHAERLVLHPGARTSTHQMPVARLSKPQIDDRLAFSRAVQPAVRPSASKQPEWATRSSSANDAADRAALLDWAVQQRRASVTTRASTPVSGDNDWNVRMTQRRITDNPDAFETGRAGN